MEDMRDESKRHDQFVAVIRRIRNLHTEAANLMAHCEGIGVPDDVLERLRVIEADLRALRDR